MTTHYDHDLVRGHGPYDNGAKWQAQMSIEY